MTTVTLECVGSWSESERELVERASKLLESCVRSDEFLTDIRDATYNDPVLRRHQRMERVDSGRIADIIAGGWAEHDAVPAGRIHLVVQHQRLSPETRAFVTPGLPTIHLSTVFLAECVSASDAASLAGLLLHEWMHVAGFQHESARDPADVPNAIGGLATRAAQRITTS